MITLLLLAAALTGDASKAQAPANEDTLAQLLSVRRVYVDKLAGGETAGQIRDMIIASLQASRLFVITENQERADAVLRGSAEDLVFTDTFQSSDSVDARINAGTGSSRTNSTTRSGRNAGISIGENDSTRIAERKHEAAASVRLVGKDGDVIWSTTQESQGAKFRGASADVADKITRQLLQDWARARKPKDVTSESAPASGAKSPR